ncbi:MAG TPA: hypothetical protein VN661_06515 [Candidatus Acidoferrales bacterium]|nr:hypothetical protein [Candidatus Acidoferrales bacterium]
MNFERSNSGPENLETGGTNSYSVEVSGWDAKENFFVEKTTLGWEAGSHREIGLASAVRPGAVVFVRLLRPLADGKDFPIAYEVIKTAGKNRDGRGRVLLMRLQPQEERNRRYGTPGAQKAS